MICKEMMQAKQHFLSSAASYNQHNINLMAHLIHCSYSLSLSIRSIFLVNNSKNSYKLSNYRYNHTVLNFLKLNNNFHHEITCMFTLIKCVLKDLLGLSNININHKNLDDVHNRLYYNSLIYK